MIVVQLAVAGLALLCDADRVLSIGGDTQMAVTLGLRPCHGLGVASAVCG